MRKTRFLSVVAAAVLVAPASAAAAAAAHDATRDGRGAQPVTTLTLTVTQSSSTSPTTSTTTSSTTTTSTSSTTTTKGAPKQHQSSRYVNPFANPRWEPGRIDMGMDWAPLRRLPVLAIGDATILGSEDHSGWPGGHFIYYQLDDGPLRGAIVYVAEHLTRLLPAGRTVHAGQQIAVAVPGYPYIETGWADGYGSPRAYPCYREGKPTNSGREMAQLLGSLGADLGLTLHRIPARPAGKRC